MLWFRKKVILRRRHMIHPDFIQQFLQDKYKGKIQIVEDDNYACDVKVGDLSFEIKERALPDYLYSKQDILIETIQDIKRFLDVADYFEKTPTQYMKPNLQLLNRCLGWIYCEQADYLIYIKYNTEKSQQTIYVIDFPALKNYYINTISRRARGTYETKGNNLSRSNDLSLNIVIPVSELASFTQTYLYQVNL